MKNIILVLLLVCLLFSCEVPGDKITSDPDNMAAEFSTTSTPGASSGSVTWGPYYDWTYGERDNPNSTAHGFWLEVYYHNSWYWGTENDGTATIGPDEVLVGGGAYTYGYIPSLTTGPFLTASNPVMEGDPVLENGQYRYNDAKSWHGNSRGAIGQQTPHYLVVQAVGMKIAGVFGDYTVTAPNGYYYLSRTKLLEYMRYLRSPDSAWGEWPRTTVSLPATTSTSIPLKGGFQTLSGGAEVVNDYGWGNFLTDSFGVGALSGGLWYAGSKDHGYYSPASIRAYIIGLAQNSCVARGSLYYCNNMNNSSKPTTMSQLFDPAWTVNAPGGGSITYARRQNTSETEWFHAAVVIGVGARSDYYGSGRMITGLQVGPKAVYAATKDCGDAVSGAIVPQIWAILFDND